MDSKSRKAFFANIAKLPLEEKIETIFEIVEEKEAAELVKKQIIRSKLETTEKLALLSKYFGQDVAEDIIFQLQKNETRKNANLADTLSLRDYIKSREDLKYFLTNAALGTGSINQSVKTFLKAIAAFLDLKRDMNERIGEEDCKIIQSLLPVDQYPLYRDQMNRIIHMAFRFQGQKIKRIAFRFFDEVLTRYQTVEVAIFFNLLEGEYLSKEMSVIIKTHLQLIVGDEFLCKKVQEELLRIQSVAATQKEKKELQNVLDMVTEAVLAREHQKQLLAQTAAG